VEHVVTADGVKSVTNIYLNNPILWLLYHTLKTTDQQFGASLDTDPHL
jgi:hypothetical protein